jgi:hypothetical protein
MSKKKIAYCPKNKKHKLFLTTAHVVQEWKVDQYGNFHSSIKDALEVVSEPDPSNTWTCYLCGTEAEFKEEE